MEENDLANPQNENGAGRAQEKIEGAMEALRLHIETTENHWRMNGSGMTYFIAHVPKGAEGAYSKRAEGAYSIRFSANVVAVRWQGLEGMPSGKLIESVIGEDESADGILLVVKELLQQTMSRIEAVTLFGR